MSCPSVAIALTGYRQIEKKLAQKPATKRVDPMK